MANNIHLVYLWDSTNAKWVKGLADASGNLISTFGGIAAENISGVSDADVGARRDITLTRKGAIFAAHGVALSAGAQSPGSVFSIAENDDERPLAIAQWLVSPDGNFDPLKGAGDIAPHLGAMNIALIGGDITLRASATAGEADGQSTGVDNLGWVKSFIAHLDVTVVPTGGSPTLEVHIQTQLSSGDWIDIVAFTQVVGSTTNEVVAYMPGAGGIGTGTIADGEVVVVSVTFAENQALDTQDIRLIPLGDSLRIDWDFVAGSSTGDYTFAVTGTFHS